MKFKQKMTAAAAVLLCCCVLFSAAETPKTRPSVALVLAGGGARGFVYIPFLELIDELGIPIDMIVGTSAGAIIGGLYCAGYTPQEIHDSVLYLDWVDIFRNDNFSPFEHALNEHGLPANPIALKLGANLSLNLGKGLLTGQKAYEQLKSLTIKIPSYIDFDSLSVPFRAAATDLLTGKLAIFEQGDLAEAMRASMSIPGLFEPFPVDGRYYIDGSASDNLPIRTAKELGFDIIIAVEISNPLRTNADDFDSSPLKVLEQMVSMQQAIKGKEDYAMADLVMFPDIRDFSPIDYFRAEDIYKRGKVEAERYRGSLIELKKKIFPAQDAAPSSLAEKNPPEENPQSAQNGKIDGFRFIETQETVPLHKGTYAGLPYARPSEFVLKGCKVSDKHYFERIFASAADKPFTKQTLLNLTDAAMDTGNYTSAVSRIDARGDKNVLELSLQKKPEENGLVLQSLTFAGTASSASSGALTLSTAAQFRGLGGTGSVISLRVSYVNNTAFDFLFFQPLGPKFFFQTKASVSHEPDFFSSNFDFHAVNGSLIRRASLKAGAGILFNPYHTLVNEGALRWLDTRQAIPYDTAWPFAPYDKNLYDFTADISSLYTFRNLNFRSFPTKGFFSSTEAQAVLPLGQRYDVRIFDRIKTDFTAALPVSQHLTVLCSLFAGSCLSEQLKKTPSLIPVYGFNLKDRLFFPHVTAARKYGIHKAAASLALQIQPWQQLTILGGQLFFSLTGSVGDVWPDFASFAQSPDLTWRVSAGTGVRIKGLFSVRLCAGAGSSDGKISPFASCDYGIALY